MSTPSSSPLGQRVRVLAMTSEPPWPLNSGGHIRSFHLLRALAAETDLRVLCPVQPRQMGAVNALRERGITAIAQPVRTRTRLGTACGLLAAALRNEPYVMYRRHAWPEVAVAWEAEIKGFQPDVLYLDHLDSAIYLPLSSGHPPAVVDLHNVYSLLAHRAAQEQPNRLKQAFLRREARLLDRVEQRVACSGATLFAVSRLEADHFQTLGARAVHVIPNGVDFAAFADLPTGRLADPPVILFLGAMSWGPNTAAARFLATVMMPQLRERFPMARLLVVGRDPPPDLCVLSGSNGVEVTGEVPDVKPYLRQASLMAVPLDAGGGTRLKILEAFAAGLPVVSTPVGAEGIDASPDRHMILAERPDFVNAVAALLTAPADATQMAAAARELARRAYDWGEIGRTAIAQVRRAAGTPSA